MWSRLSLLQTSRTDENLVISGACASVSENSSTNDVLCRRRRPFPLSAGRIPISLLRLRKSGQEDVAAAPPSSVMNSRRFSSGKDVRFIARPPHRTVRAAFPHTACMRLSLSRCIAHFSCYCFILLFDRAASILPSRPILPSPPRAASVKDGACNTSKSCARWRTCSSAAMCNAFGSRTEPSRRNAFGQHASRLAEVCESPLANKTTACPRATSSSASHEMTRSVPP
jgi:hypothetical protein